MRTLEAINAEYSGTAMSYGDALFKLNLAHKDAAALFEKMGSLNKEAHDLRLAEAASEDPVPQAEEKLA